MARITLPLEMLEKDLTRRFKAIPRAIKDSVEQAAGDGRTILRKKTPKDTGSLERAWRVKADKDVELVNEMPYAGVVERGAKPHGVDENAIASITDWAQRKIGLSEKEAQGLAFGLAKKIGEKGQEPTFFVKNSLDELSKALKARAEGGLRTVARRKF